jgi:hypothetical protein
LAQLQILTGLCGTLALRLDTLGQSWFSVRRGQVGVVAGGTKNLAAEITLLGVHVTEPGSAVVALRFGCPLAGIAVGIFHAAHQDDLAITGRRHSETLTNFITSRAEVLAWEGHDFQSCHMSSKKTLLCHALEVLQRLTILLA